MWGVWHEEGGWERDVLLLQLVEVVAELGSGCGRCFAILAQSIVWLGQVAMRLRVLVVGGIKRLMCWVAIVSTSKYQAMRSWGRSRGVSPISL